MRIRRRVRRGSRADRSCMASEIFVAAEDGPEPSAGGLVDAPTQAIEVPLQLAGERVRHRVGPASWIDAGAAGAAVQQVGAEAAALELFVGERRQRGVPR